jgi:hypothetical protein
MGAILAESPALAGEYGRIFLSYGLETGRDDNFLDHPPLRIGLYQGIGWLATENAAAAGPALPCLVKALGVENHPLRGMAAYALRQLAKTAPGSAFLPCAGSGRDVWGEAETALARALAAESAAQGPPDMLDVLDGEREQRVSVADMLAQALGVVRQRLAL